MIEKTNEREHWRRDQVGAYLSLIYCGRHFKVVLKFYSFHAPFAVHTSLLFGYATVYQRL